LREMPYVDETKVCVVGHDIGATAALQATALDSSITAVVADGCGRGLRIGRGRFFRGRRRGRGGVGGRAGGVADGVAGAVVCGDV